MPSTTRKPDPSQPLLSEFDPLSPTQDPSYVVIFTQPPPPDRHRLFRKKWRRCLLCLAAAIPILAAAGYLFWPSDPDLSVQRLRLDRIRFHMRPKIAVDVTLDVTVKVRNPDLYSMEYDPLRVSIGYRGKPLGFVEVEGGEIVARGATYVNATLLLERVEVVGEVIPLLEDLARGAVPFDTESKFSGRLGVLFFSIPLKTKMSCEITVNPKTQKIARQSCYPEISEISEVEPSL